MSKAGYRSEEILLELATAKRYTLGKFEAAMWLDLIESQGDSAVEAFLVQHVRTSQWFPSISSAVEYFGLVPSSDDALLNLAVLVQSHGPYRAPDLSADPSLAAAVAQLGGWEAVNEAMPALQTVEFQSFAKRFGEAYRRAQSLVRGAVAIGGGSPKSVALTSGGR